MLTLRHFTIFKAVTETGNFTKAAQRLYITQSAVSHTIRELEEYTGTVLFDRFSKQVQLTANGKLLLEEIVPILAACENLEKRIGHLDRKAPLHIVSSITIASFWLPFVLQEMKLRMPDTPVNVTVVSAAEAVKVLSAGEADVAFVEGIQPQGPFLCKHFAGDELKMVCAPKYRFGVQDLQRCHVQAGNRVCQAVADSSCQSVKENADSRAEGNAEGRAENCAEKFAGEDTSITVVLPETMSVEEFCGENLLLREKGSAVRDTLDNRLFLLGHTVHPRWVSVNSTALMKAAKAGLGIAVLPEELVKEELEGGRLIELKVEGLTLNNDFIAVWHKDKYMTPALKTLLEFT